MVSPSSCPPNELPLPAAAVLARLALSDNGFAFDPVSGDSFTLNQSGLTLIRAFLHHRTLQEVLEAVQQEFEVGAQEAERDIHEFAVQLTGSLKP